MTLQKTHPLLKTPLQTTAERTDTQTPDPHPYKTRGDRKDGQLSHFPLVSLFLFNLDQKSTGPVNHHAQDNEVVALN